MQTQQSDLLTPINSDENLRQYYSELHVNLLFGKEAHISFGKKIEKNLRQRISKDNRVYVMRVYKEAS